MFIAGKEKWLPSEGIILEKNAKSSIVVPGNALVIAGPGAGKTELLAQKSNYLLETNICKDPNRILAISFKKDAAKNLKDRVISRGGKDASNRFDSMTYDAFAKSLLDHFRLALPPDLRPNSDYRIAVTRDDREIIKKAFEKYNYYDSKAYDAILTSVLLPFNQDKIGEKVWRFLLNGDDGHTSMLTFQMISMLAEFIVKTNWMIKICIQSTYKYVFLDEFQDTTSLQYNLVKQCFLGSNTIITAVGDNKQRIMVWAGARKTVFEDFQNDFSATLFKLVMNHRSAPRLVELQRQMYASLNEIDTNISHSNEWDANAGNINLIIADNVKSETVTIVNMILQKIASGVQPSQICILCKQKPEQYTNLIIELLEQNNINARIENDYQDLIKEPIIDILLSIFSLAYDRKQPNDWLLVLDSIVVLWNNSYLQSDEGYASTQIKIDQELTWIEQHIGFVSTKKDFNNILKQIVNFIGIEHIKSMFSEYRQGRYLYEILNKFAALFWAELEKASMDVKMAVDKFKGVHSIPIMTIHKSKGLEYDTVFFVGLEDSAFWNFKKQPEDDRCAFFVALSRAKSEITFTFCKTRNNTMQHHTEINEFFELLQEPGVSNIVDC